MLITTVQSLQPLLKSLKVHTAHLFPLGGGGILYLGRQLGALFYNDYMNRILCSIFISLPE